MNKLAFLEGYMSKEAGVQAAPVSKVGSGKTDTAVDNPDFMTIWRKNNPAKYKAIMSNPGWTN